MYGEGLCVGEVGLRIILRFLFYLFRRMKG